MVKCRLVRGGHLAPLWIGRNCILDFTPLKGIPLGITPGFRYEKKEIVLSPGESFLFFSDGVIEAENENRELFSNRRVVDYIRNSKGPPWAKGLVELINQWRGNSEINDDMTILEIWRDP